jgi:regulatory protein
MFRSRGPAPGRTASTSGTGTAADGGAREAALKLLDHQRRTRRDLARRLRDKGHDPAEVEQTLDRLAQVGLIDDVEFARAFIAGRWGRRAAGWRRIEGDLRGKGVSADDIAAARARFEAEQGGENGVDESAAARRVVQQAERRYAALDPRVRRQRLTALLLRRGFSYDTIEQVLRAGSAERE